MVILCWGHKNAIFFNSTFPKNILQLYAQHLVFGHFAHTDILGANLPKAFSKLEHNRSIREMDFQKTNYTYIIKCNQLQIIVVVLSMLLIPTIYPKALIEFLRNTLNKPMNEK